MLSKEVCKFCFEHHHGYYTDFFLWFTWQDHDRWNNSQVHCPSSLLPDDLLDVDATKEQTRFINEEPPRWCPYFLEHIMDTQKC